MLFPDAAEPLSVILKPAGSRCNLDCLYCYDKRRELADAGYVSSTILRNFLSAASGHPLNISLHGGEPSLTPLHRLEEIAKVLAEHDSEVTVNIVTNGKLLDTKLLHSLRKIWSELTFTISYDGPNEMSDYRTDFKGRNTAKYAESAMRVLSNEGIDFTVLSVVTQKSLGNAESFVNKLRTFPKLKMLKLLPCFDISVSQSLAGRRFRSPNHLTVLDEISGLAPWATTPSEYTEYVLEVTKIWKSAELFNNFVLDPTTSVMMSLMGSDSGYTDFSWKKQPYIVVISPTGILSTSDEFESNLAYIANLQTPLKMPIADAIRNNPIRLWKKCNEISEKCFSCSHNKICKGGNLPDRITLIEDDMLTEQYCSSRITLINEIEKLMGTK